MTAIAIRNSNIELLRIVAMLLVVTGHAVVHSGIGDCFDFTHMPSMNMLLQQWVGMWGKTAINAFVLISGYFMCTSRLTVKRYFKIYGVAQFWVLATWLFLWSRGHGEHISIERIVQLFVWPATEINHLFTASFLVFYLGIPFYNALIRRLESQGSGLRLLATGMVAIFVIPYTFFGNHGVFNWVFWYVALYFTGALIRLRPYAWMDRNSICVPLLSIAVFAAIAGVWLHDWNAVHHWPSMFLRVPCVLAGVIESCSFMAFAIGLLVFCVFKNLRLPGNAIINALASTTFGILCIHDACGAMRHFVWRDVFDLKNHYCWWWTVLSAILCFLSCALLDFVRKELSRRIGRKLHGAMSQFLFKRQSSN